MLYRGMILLLLSFAGLRGESAEKWAYCTEDLKAYKRVSIKQKLCPKRPGLQPQKAAPLDAELCSSVTREHTLDVPELDYVCQLPTAASTGEAVVPNTFRCLNADRRQCIVGQGGEEGPGAHNVPQDAWYSIAGTNLAFPTIRCQCGCFAGETLLLTPEGEQPIASLARRARSRPLQVLRAEAKSGGVFVASRLLDGAAFTVGPESAPLVRIAIEGGRQLLLTVQHPVLVLRQGHWSMQQAGTLRGSDMLLASRGQTLQIDEIDRKVSDHPQLVYNLDTGEAEPREHLILAEGIVVGDSYWQKRLSERQSRIEELLRARATSSRSR